VILKWTTISETNNNYFEIQRSADMQKWLSIEHVKAAGNSNEVRQYQVIDNHPLKGRSYYRLKQIDFDGSYTFSDIRTVFVQFESIQLYPNPVKNQLMIETYSYIVSITVFDISGKQFRMSVNKQDGLYQLDMSGVSRGVYYIQITTSNEVKTYKVIKN
jgi:hypothetical protein